MMKIYGTALAAYLAFANVAQAQTPFLQGDAGIEEQVAARLRKTPLQDLATSLQAGEFVAAPDGQGRLDLRYNFSLKNPENAKAVYCKAAGIDWPIPVDPAMESLAAQLVLKAGAKAGFTPRMCLPPNR